MNNDMNQKVTNEFLSELYKNIKMGSDGIIDISSKAKEGKFRDELARELDAYEKMSRKIGKLLYESGETPKEENIMKKMAAKVGMAMSTLTDDTVSHLAEMTIEGANMGITECTKLMNEYKGKGVSDEAIYLAKDSVKFMEESIERLKPFL